MKNVRHNKRTRAAKMFLAGVAKENICLKLDITSNIFDEWIGCDDFRQFRKNIAFIMFVAEVPEFEICRQLGIAEEKLHKWVSEGYKNGSVAQIIAKQYKNGLHPWITEICRANTGITFMN